MAYAFSEKSVGRIVRAVESFERQGIGTTVNDRPYLPSGDDQIIRITDGTPDGSGRYTAVITRYVAVDETWEDLAEVYALEIAGATLTDEQRYYGKRVGLASDGQPVFLVQAGSGSGGISGTALRDFPVNDNPQFLVNQRHAYGATNLASSGNGNKDWAWDRCQVMTQTDYIEISGYGEMKQVQASAQRFGLAHYVKRSEQNRWQGSDNFSMRISIGNWDVTPLKWAVIGTSTAGMLVADWTSTDYTSGAFFDGLTAPTIIATGDVTGSGEWFAFTTTEEIFCVFVWTVSAVAQDVEIGGSAITIYETAVIDTQVYPSYRPLREELFNCQRYYCKSYPQDVAVGSIIDGYNWTSFPTTTDAIAVTVDLPRDLYYTGISSVSVWDIAGNAGVATYNTTSHNEDLTTGNIGGRSFTAITDATTSKFNLMFHWAVHSEVVT
jgi:hypothetical protein